MHRQSQHFYEFGPFRLDTVKRLLLRGGEVVPLTPKTFDTLLALIESAGEVVGKDELMRRVWPDSFVEEGNLAYHISLLRKALGETLNEHRYIVTVPGRGYRFVASIQEVEGKIAEPVTILPEITSQQATGEIAKTLTTSADGKETAGATSSVKSFINLTNRYKRGAILILAALVVVAATAFSFYFNRKPALTETDSVMLADFVNMTRDADFDGTLKLALALQLEQSPLLNIFSDEQVRETLRFMKRSPEERVTRELAREICERQGLKAFLIGSITSLGSHYVIALEAINARTGDVIAHYQVDTESKELVRQTLGTAATKLREKLGESLPSIQKFNAPIEQATTSSLEAFKAFTQGSELASKLDFRGAIQFMERAIELDPNFALAYSSLAYDYANISRRELAIEYAKKAFALRDQVNELERLRISQYYHVLVEGDHDKVFDVLTMWKQSYPRDWRPHNNLAGEYMNRGQYEEALVEALEAFRLNPKAPNVYGRSDILIALNRFDEAKEIIKQAQAQKIDHISMREGLYKIAFILGDAAGMKQ